MHDTPLHLSKPTGKSLWQQYRIYRDRLELQSWFFLHTLVIPARDIVSVEVRPSVLRGTPPPILSKPASPFCRAGEPIPPMVWPKTRRALLLLLGEQGWVEGGSSNSYPATAAPMCSMTYSSKDS